MNADAIVKVLLAAIGLLGTLATLGAGLARELFRYLNARIAVLEGRETTVLTGIVGAMKTMGEEQAAQGELIRSVAKEAERDAWERERRQENRP